MNDSATLPTSNYRMQVADTPALALAAYRLRYEVYCLDRGHLEGIDGLEYDEFDDRARHVVLVDRGEGVIGTARLILSNPDAPAHSWPIQAVCRDWRLAGMPVHATGEVSRFALRRQGRGARAAAEMRHALVRGLIEASREECVTHWCAVMDPALVRLLRVSGIHFDLLGPMVEWHGMRQPCAVRIDDMLAHVLAERPDVWASLQSS